jgi:type II secretory pathway pseudopilin PulG
MQKNRLLYWNKGFTYLGLLLFIAITGIFLSIIGITWQYEMRSEKEKQLLFVGEQFRVAIKAYYTTSPGDAKVYPLNLEDLLLDKRVPYVRRHLRQIYLDPMTGNPNWGVVKQKGRIVGIFSKSSLKPFKHSGFSNEEADFIGAKSYEDWIFGIPDGIKSNTQK